MRVPVMPPDGLCSVVGLEATWHQLIRDAESSVRRLMSDKLADIPTVPRDLIKTLANDEIEVAVPVLKKSTVLQDVDLIELRRAMRAS